MLSLTTARYSSNTLIPITSADTMSTTTRIPIIHRVLSYAERVEKLAIAKGLIFAVDF